MATELYCEKAVLERAGNHWHAVVFETVRAKKKARAAGWDEEAYQQHIAQEGNSIALSKLDRGFDTDFDDIIFLIQQNLVSLNELERITRDALPHAREYDFHLDILDHLKELKNRIG